MKDVSIRMAEIGLLFAALFLCLPPRCHPLKQRRFRYFRQLLSPHSFLPQAAFCVGKPIGGGRLQRLLCFWYLPTC